MNIFLFYIIFIIIILIFFIIRILKQYKKINNSDKYIHDPYMRNYLQKIQYDNRYGIQYNTQYDTECDIRYDTQININNEIQNEINHIDTILISNNDNDKKYARYILEEIKLREEQKLEEKLLREIEENRKRYLEFKERENKKYQLNNYQFNTTPDNRPKINNSQITPNIILSYNPLIRKTPTISNAVKLKRVNKRNIYNDTQNVHTSSINDSVLQIAYELSKENVSEKNFEQEIKNLKSIDIKINNSINKIFNDKSVYKNGVNLKKTFLGLLHFINNHKDKDELNKRLQEELREMSDLCTTGHLSRLTNTIQGFDISKKLEIKIDPLEEFFAKLSSKVQLNIDNDALDWIISDKPKFENWLRKLIENEKLYNEYNSDIIEKGIKKYIK